MCYWCETRKVCLMCGKPLPTQNAHSACTVDSIVGRVELERNKCITKREEKVELRDHIGAVGWDGKVQGLSMALAILREPNAGHEPVRR